MKPAKYPTTLHEHREFTRINRRIDLLKRSLPHQSAPKASFSPFEYHLDEHGSIRRNAPKRPSRTAVRKNTRRARLYEKYVQDLAARTA